MDPAQLKQSIENGIAGSRVEVQDLTGSGNHFQATVISDQFEGKTRVEQHQLVYAALQREIEGDLHAVSLKTYTSSAWQQLEASRESGRVSPGARKGE